VKTGQCFMEPEQAPPGFWPWPAAQPVLVDGVELESGVPTRFFQTVDAFPPEWGRLTWRVQLNKIDSGRAGPPVFRTFYPGTEWNLARPDHQWFLSAWLRWEGPGPPYRAPAPEAVRVVGDTVLFHIAWLPKPGDFPDAAPEPDLDRPIFLRSRVDARDRRSIAESLQAQPARPAKADSGVITLDDFFIKKSE